MLNAYHNITNMVLSLTPNEDYTVPPRSADYRLRTAALRHSQG